MTQEHGCIFCGIVAGDLRSTTIAETERAIAFMDINPVTPGHALVIPRAHATDLLDTKPDDLAACIDLAQRIAQRAESALVPTASTCSTAAVKRPSRRCSMCTST